MPENLCVAREQRCVADMQSGPPTCMPFATIFMPFVGFLFCVYELKVSCFSAACWSIHCFCQLSKKPTELELDSSIHL